MKVSISTKFNLGIIFLFLIILVLFVFSAYFLNRMSKKTSAILKENLLSVNYARDMSESLVIINQEVTSFALTNKYPDSLLIKGRLNSFNKSMELERNNITEPGEKKLVAGIESGFNEYHDSVLKILHSAKPGTEVINMRKPFAALYQQLVLLSQINETAIEVKTNDAKVSAKMAVKQMSILGTLCFLIALSFTYRFATYFSERFFQLYNGIKEIGSGNYGHRLYFEGKDEFYDISLVFNEMAEKLSTNNQKMELNLRIDKDKEQILDDVQELKRFLERIRNVEKQATELISRLENKK